ncbi:uncharacterized protein LOC115569127 isoform X2 [Sparus aurata]|nr:uncharacterized protein LOC115569127 isoform X2 [Sparus aurata]XP_030252920.1 uncharacterized protein LOC115569127 isoform X2 [Sparus aurata]XP_030252921.1 uncharacterized protein LOC115569127 isoform X2 [Sparus aurata]XP_030252922.1 uncharacterized protein LOC115569127 isoform X2 [Sparus aurata]XP_030252923.1 uncharacterized protein LOC115569127 isoform X2 [Sparus aurata]XP_030252924.1 uncharacterized protein LOC115569127 isoform X2 [Sparus aurata]
MSTADELLELMFSWIEERECCAEQLRKLAQELESLREKCNAVECVGSVASVVGAASMIGAGVATFFTAGAAAPLLAVAGGVYTGLGVTVSVATKITEHFLSSDTLKEAQQIEENSNNIARKIQKQFEQLNAQAKERSPFADPDEVDQHVMTEIVGAMARRSGLGQNIGFSTEFFSNPALGAMMMNQSSNSAMAAGFTLQVVSILTFFSLKNGGKKFDILFAEGAKQLVKKVATTGFKTALKGGAMVVGGAVGMGFALYEAIDSWTDLIKNNNVTEAGQSLRDTAYDIRKICETLKKLFSEMREKFEELAEVKHIIENSDRSCEEKRKLIDYVIKMSSDEEVKKWLTENYDSVAFFELVDMFNFLKQELDKEKHKTDCEDIDITFVAHGAIIGSMIPACCLLPLPSIKDVLLYSPWNCFISADVAYGIATGMIRPQNRCFFCMQQGCQIHDIFHQPSNLPFYWNSMNAAKGLMIPNIIVSPLKAPEDDAWNHFVLLRGTHGEPAINRVVIPFILPRWMSFVEDIPFRIVTLTMSLVLLFSSYRATVHLSACLGRYGGEVLNQGYLSAQYAYTIDKTYMASSEEMYFHRNTDLYRAFKAVFG